MTTKEEVLRLISEAGLDTVSDHWKDWQELQMGYSFTDLTKLIELAKQAGAAEERTVSYEREKEIVRLACLAAADQAREHQKEIEAIRNRERKE